MLASVALADTEWTGDGHSYDQARQALHRGEVMSLSNVIQYLRKYTDGDIVAIEYEHEFKRWVYEFVLLDDKGRMSKVHVDAKDGSLVQVSDD
jgi:uncharacterized membrane protein YkoI